MTNSYAGQGVLGAGGALGASGIHLPNHERVKEHVDKVRDAVHGPSGGGHGGLSGGRADPGESAWMMGGHPVDLIFGDPVAAEAHHYSLAAIPVGGGVTMSIVALFTALCLLIVLGSTIYRTVAVKCARMHVSIHRKVRTERSPA